MAAFISDDAIRVALSPPPFAPIPATAILALVEEHSLTYYILHFMFVDLGLYVFIEDVTKVL